MLLGDDCAPIMTLLSFNHLIGIIVKFIAEKLAASRIVIILMIAFQPKSWCFFGIGSVVAAIEKHKIAMFMGLNANLNSLD